MIVFGRVIMGQLAEHGRQLAEHGSRLAEYGSQLVEINRALGRLEGRQAAEESPAQT